MAKKDKGHNSFPAINLFVSFLMIFDNTFDGEGGKSFKYFREIKGSHIQVAIFPKP
jgi:hypothetical protein